MPQPAKLTKSSSSCADWPWLEDETLAWDPDSATGEQIAQDHMAATEWYRSFKRSRKQLDPVATEAQGHDEPIRGPEGGGSPQVSLGQAGLWLTLQLWGMLA